MQEVPYVSIRTCLTPYLILHPPCLLLSSTPWGVLPNRPTRHDVGLRIGILVVQQGLPRVVDTPYWSFVCLGRCLWWQTPLDPPVGVSWDHLLGDVLGIKEANYPAA